jgi:hypothetical protein
MKASNSNAKEKYWLDHIRQAEQCGETFKHYAERQGLKLHALYDWRSRLRSKGLLDALPRTVAKKSVTFAKVIAVPSSFRTGIELRVGGVTLSAETLPDPVWLVRLVHALELRS